MGCLLVLGVPGLLLGEAALLYVAAMLYVEGRYDELGFVDGGGTQGGQEEGRLWFWCMLIAFLIPSAAASWLVWRRRRHPRL